MSADINVARLMDRIETLSKANDTQAETINRYSRRNAALERRVEALQAMVGKVSITPSGGARIKREGR